MEYFPQIDIEHRTQLVLSFYYAFMVLFVFHPHYEKTTMDLLQYVSVTGKKQISFGRTFLHELSL